MSVQAQVYGQNTGLTYVTQGQSVPFRADNFGDQGVNQVLGRYTSLALNGNLYVMSQNSTQAGIAGVVAPPTTTSGFILYNAAAASTKTVLMPLWVGVTAKSGTIGSGLTIECGLTSGALATPLTANGSNVIIKNMLDGVTADSTTFADINKTVVQASYVNFSSGGAAVGIGSGLSVDVGGMFVIKPTFAFDVSVLGPTGTSPVYFVSIVYAKLSMDMGSAA